MIRCYILRVEPAVLIGGGIKLGEFSSDRNVIGFRRKKVQRTG